jgi:hypothetical protein
VAKARADLLPPTPPAPYLPGTGTPAERLTALEAGYASIASYLLTVGAAIAELDAEISYSRARQAVNERLARMDIARPPRSIAEYARRRASLEAEAAR